ncbi:MAG: HD domain-containing phosphohydrolase [Spirochaetota bacterium]
MGQCERGDNISKYQGIHEVELYNLDIPGVPGILIVDDERSLRELIGAVLAGNGLGCDMAGSVSEAEELIAGSGYDIVFLDLGLPDGSGFELLERMMESSPGVVVVVITGLHDLDTAVGAIRRGAFDYVTKPFSISLLQERLGSAVEEWKSRTFTRHYQKYLEELVKNKARQLGRTVERIDQIYDMTVYALGAALDLRDPETEEHCRRVSENSVVLGRRVGMEGRGLKELKWGAYLHDIGKIGIAEEILQKRGRLTEEEMEVVRKHSLLGYSMISNIDFLDEAGKVVLYHHERYDGGGYPLGLEGERIPLMARVFAVIDAFDAMTTDRPYREAVGYAEAVEELEGCSGSHFDPVVVEEFKKIAAGELWIGGGKTRE